MGTQPTQVGEWKAGRAQAASAIVAPRSTILGESLGGMAILDSIKFKSIEKITVKV